VLLVHKPLRKSVALAATAVMAVTLIGVFDASIQPAAADTVQQRRDQVVKKRQQIKVQIDLAKASDTAIQAEVNRLGRLVSIEQAALVQAQHALAASQSAVADAQRRLAQIDAQSSAARKALVGRAIDLYEHPFRDQVIALSGVGSINDYAERQALLSEVQGQTSNVLDTYRQQHLDEAAAHRALFAAQADAERRRNDVESEAQRLGAAKFEADKANTALRQKIAGLQRESQILAQQESTLEAQLAAAEAGLPPGVIPPGGGRLMWPLHGPVTQEFGRHAGGFHPGIDIAAAWGTPIHASGTGAVVYAGWEGGYGNYTCISHGGAIATCYGHQSAIYVHVGQVVREGQVIGAEGSTGDSTGPHVHFEVRVNNVPNNPRAFIPGNP
jgi:murein DD-endopeptidase MepM/ murein hydrolase activator NlpD